MKALKILLIVVAAIVAAFFGVAFLLPNETMVEREIVVEASPAKVFTAVSDMRDFGQWDPWSPLDPNMKITISDPAYGVGASRAWSGNSSVGTGTMTVVTATPFEKVVTALDFGEHGTAFGTYEISEVEEGTRVVWRFDTKHQKLLHRYFGLMMDGMVGRDYEKGLSQLKTYVEAMADIRSESIVYEEDNTEFQGYVAYPVDLLDPSPAVLVVHEWWGHNEYARERADMLAKEGYVAMAVDMFGGGETASHPEDAMAFIQSVAADSDLASRRFDAAYQTLANLPYTDPSKIAAIGYCFGGAVVINMARSGKNLKGVASFHGSLGKLVPVADNAFTPVMVFNGAADPFITEAQITFLEQDMEKHELPLTFVNYPDVVHSFTNPGADELGEKFELPLAYDANADKDSWAKTQEFLKDVFF